MKKLLVRIFLALVVIVPVGAIGGYFWLKSVVTLAVEQVVTAASGQEMTVAKISLQRFGGTMRWNGQMEANPKGSNRANLTQPCTFDVEMQIGSLLEDKLVFKKLELDGLNVYIDRDQPMPESIISVIMDDLKKLGGGEKPKEGKPSEGEKVRVDRITIKNGVAHVNVLTRPELTIEIPLVELEMIELKSVAGDPPAGSPQIGKPSKT